MADCENNAILADAESLHKRLTQPASGVLCLLGEKHCQLVYKRPTDAERRRRAICGFTWRGFVCKLDHNDNGVSRSKVLAETFKFVCFTGRLVELLTYVSYRKRRCSQGSIRKPDSYSIIGLAVYPPSYLIEPSTFREALVKLGPVFPLEASMATPGQPESAGGDPGRKNLAQGNPAPDDPAPDDPEKIF